MARTVAELPAGSRITAPETAMPTPNSGTRKRQWLPRPQRDPVAAIPTDYHSDSHFSRPQAD